MDLEAHFVLEVGLAEYISEDTDRYTKSNTSMI